MRIQNLCVIIVALLLLYIYIKNVSVDVKNPTQANIQKLENVMDVNGSLVEVPILETDGLPDPQMSRGFKKLSPGGLSVPLDNLKELLPKGKAVLPIVRTAKDLTPKREYLPDYYRKDTMPMNNIGSEEYRPFVRDSEEPDRSWTDANVSEHPKFYSVAIKNDDLTNIGAFFDKDNEYNDTTSCNTLALPSDKCYVDKDGGKFCLDNTRLQMRPPALITDPQNNYAINEIGMYKDYASIPDDPNRVMNGGDFYKGVRGSAPLGHNEIPSIPYKDPTGFA